MNLKILDNFFHLIAKVWNSFYWLETNNYNIFQKKFFKDTKIIFEFFQKNIISKYVKINNYKILLTNTYIFYKYVSIKINTKNCLEKS